MTPKPLASDKVKNYLIFLAILSAIFSLIAIRGNYILAPPYAVSAYLIVFQRDPKYSGKKSLLVTYVLVIGTSDIIHILIGTGLVEIVVNVLIVSAFITFTDFSHPPAIALAIFSYLVGDPFDFTVSSILALSALIISAMIIEKFRLGMSRQS
ncbi:MAG: HPP family protein [Thermoplasmataceae archaeon]